MRKPRHIRPRSEKPRYVNTVKMHAIKVKHGKAVPEIHFGGTDISFIEPKYRFAYITSRVEGAQ